jgi:DNA invertase Pin-like site-specific DNA recombinase
MKLDAIYLRKSRKDIEAEMQGAGDTLKRHEELLMETAKVNHCHVGEIYREIKSGESIADRPEMMRLLADVAAEKWRSVLVTEVPRLARGKTADQGLVAETFAKSGTLIITPTGVIDPGEDTGEDRLDLDLFMARWEYKSIKRRQLRGRQSSLEEGKFIGSQAPFGYQRYKLNGQKGWSLEIIPEEAEIVKKIYADFLSGAAIHHITKKLNLTGIHTRTGKLWRAPTVRQILSNPTYTGNVWWGKRNQGKREKKEPLIFKGLHQAIIEPETFSAAQALFESNAAPPTDSIQNPLSGIVRCGRCGATMIRQPDSRHVRRDQLRCRTHGCTNIAAPLEDVENAIIASLDQWLRQYQLDLKNAEKDRSIFQQEETLKAAIKQKEKEINDLHQQLDKTYTLLEQGVYTTEVFLERNHKINARRTEEENNLDILYGELKNMVTIDNKKEAIPSIQQVIEGYRKLKESESKNKMLREVLEKVEYIKEPNHKSPDHFKLTLYPRLPHTPKN